MLRFRREWYGWGWGAGEAAQRLLGDVESLAHVDHRAIEWDALRGALWWLNLRRLMAEGNLIVDGLLWVTALDARGA